MYSEVRLEDILNFSTTPDTIEGVQIKDKMKFFKGIYRAYFIALRFRGIKILSFQFHGFLPKIVFDSERKIYLKNYCNVLKLNFSFIRVHSHIF